MSSSIYNHRSLQPTGPPNQNPVQRLNESFETIRQEFEGITQENALLRSQRDEFETKVTGQVNELNIIRQSLYDLESQHAKIRSQYEDEIARLKQDIDRFRQTAALSAAPGPGAPGVERSTPLMLSNPGPPGASSFDAGFHGARERERERERMVERDRDRDRASERDRERERERGERERDRDRDRERERPVDTRDTKRPKTERERMIKTDRPEMGGFSPNLAHPLPHAPSSSKLPPANQPQPYPPTASEPTPTGSVGPGGSNGFPSAGPNGGGPLTVAVAGQDDIDPHNVPPELKKEGSDWFAVFNPKVKRSLDVNLVHTLLHESVVCCVRFSADGKYLATGCNHTAQIYDAKTGTKTCVLIDENADKARDLYIRSVCFSPDGKFLATGAEDKQIRIWDIQKRKIRNVFEGHQQEIYSLAFSHDGRLIVSGSGDRTARIWDMSDGSSKILHIGESEDGGPPPPTPPPADAKADAGVTSVAISPSGHLVAAGSLDAIVRIWDVQTGTLLEKLRGHQDSVYSVAFTPDGKGLVSGSLDKTLRYWDVRGVGDRRGPGKKDEKGMCTMNFTGHKDYVLSVAVSHDANWVVSGSKDRGVQFWDSKAQWQCMLQGHKNSVISIDLSPVGSLLATGSGDWQARIWSYTSLNG
ncbi:WD40 repeat-like protein [Heliocybe sulcata]|uniref:WD40 repeat-like protein n=1 Tax=Heliocybe sulcata TaxID=5364 RepID=A0A5C3MP61_9AGAM|nr:WD40 repeat-like protein [Heliocybe sulcata]